ncbi:Cd(II)/Pb(II)-responsive transcriptional regulator [Variovorax sp. TBS-050B]|jgi:Cd(II)/Pb(II)-responsive transcriptional regulator|uniref:Cd(II)/Pb(II)-responsive transcriptional regulator n=1 Tax=Variovorax sp. TBS-050B TaxID=2940551 RepID=UPI00247623E3|nr:Cd(II)/Pb(II)-responsive transcriptional regulator [Variovorax sp. TBS-050B]MDH6593673.1 Cd(II)/Pb(II)-responsive transcriptional regulator [Variovorax sp. TBS-050B]
MKIGELARAAATPVETIRYYEREQLLPAPARTDGNYRIYDDSHAQRLGFIRRCRSLDMTLDEIRVLLRFRDAPGEDCGEVNRLLDDHIGHVAARIAELRTLEKQLKALREQCRGGESAQHCGILHELDTAALAAESLGGHAGHVHGSLHGGAKRPG